jgi:hypothetical protein
VKISNIITRLQQIFEEVGDLPAFHWDDWDAFSIEKVHVLEQDGNKYVLF